MCTPPLLPHWPITNYIASPNRRVLINEFFKAQFNYCPIIWIFHSCCLNSKINRLYEMCLRMIYNVTILNFEELLNKDISIHHNNIHAIAIEMYKVANDISPDIMTGVLKSRNTPHYKSPAYIAFFYRPNP